MTDKSSREQLDKEIEMRIEMIGKRDRNMTPDDIKALLIKEPFILTPPPITCRLRDHGPIILGIIEEALYKQ